MTMLVYRSVVTYLQSWLANLSDKSQELHQAIHRKKVILQQTFVAVVKQFEVLDFKLLLMQIFAENQEDLQHLAYTNDKNKKTYPNIPNISSH